jgi:hypothetical protein
MAHSDKLNYFTSEQLDDKPLVLIASRYFVWQITESSHTKRYIKVILTLDDRFRFFLSNSISFYFDSAILFQQRHYINEFYRYFIETCADV